MFKTILIPTDGSPLSRKAATGGIALAKATGAKIVGLFAAPPATPIIYRDSMPVGYATPREHEAIIEKIIEKNLGFVERAASKAGVPCKVIHVTSDFPDEAILKVAKERKCDLIVMGSHGKSGLRGILVGSVTQKVLNQAKIPVMVFR
ncbi:universal stress protein [Pseudorhodoplanes sp.]|uniref:universal stress protein n=1 Tax=Pseudorhodoplanes sp. TaxID=1934341 RepID=UPI003D109679